MLTHNNNNNYYYYYIKITIVSGGGGNPSKFPQCIHNIAFDNKNAFPKDDYVHRCDKLTV